MFRSSRFAFLKTDPRGSGRTRYDTSYMSYVIAYVYNKALRPASMRLPAGQLPESHGVVGLAFLQLLRGTQ